MRKRWGVGAVIAATLMLCAAPLAAWAESPVTFTSNPIVDTVGAVSGETAGVEKAIDQLYQNARVQLFVAYVDTFNDPSDAADWANVTADNNGMGDDDYLLVVATEGRNYSLSAGGGSPLSDQQLSDINRNYIEPALHDDDWAGAAIGAATGLQRASTGDSLAGSSGGSTGGGQSSGGGFVWFFILAVIVIGIVLFFVLRTRTKPTIAGKGANDKRGSLSTLELKRHAGSALVQTDDAIKTSEEELGFAIASYGSEATQGFQNALSSAQATLSSCFSLQQKLDDAEPDTEEQQRSWYTQIIEGCEKANAELDAQAADFDELRALEKNAPEAIAAARQRAREVQSRVDTARGTVTELRARYTDAAVSTVADNPEQAASRLNFAAQELAEAETQLAAAKTGEAAVAIRAAEEGTDQAALLCDAVVRLAADLETAQGSIDAALADLRSDIAAAQSLPANSDASGQLASTVVSTQQVLSDVGTKLATGRINPIEVVQRLEEANTRIDAVLGGVRDAEAASQRAQAALAQTLLAARSQVSAAEDFITARRGAVGAEARTRLAEAGRLVVQAESFSTSDAAQALSSAQRANQLATEAISLAQNDVGAFGGQSGGMGGLGSIFGGSSGAGRSSSGGDVLGAVLGGILINSTLGGSRSGGGSSSRSRSSSGSTRRSPGSFGGSGTRSRRSSGGRF